MKLRPILFLSLSFVALIPVIVFGVWPHSQAYDKELSDVSERHLLLAQNIGAALERYDRDVKATFKSVVSNLVQGTNISQTQEMLSNLDFRHICMATFEDGKIVNGLHEDAAKCPLSIPAKRFKLFKNLASSEEVRFTEVLPGPSGKPLLYLVWLISDQIAIGAIRTDYIVSLGKSIAFGKRGHAAIVDHTGKILAHPLADWRAAMKDISKISPVKRMLNHETGVSTFYSPALKEDMIAGFTWVSGANWGVMIPQPISELRERADIVQRYALYVIIAGVVAAAIVSWILSGYLTMPVLAVAQAAKRLEIGDKSVRVVINERAIPLELKKLQTSFNSMAEAIEISTNRQIDALSEAETANRAKTDFLANMSHELRTPLNAIIGFTQMMKDMVFGPLGDPKYVEYADDIDHSGRHLLTIINELLDLAKIDAGQTVLNEKSFNIGTVIRSCTQMVLVDGSNSTNRIQIKIPDKLPEFSGDERLIKQIVLNLLSNAVKFTPDNGLISVSAWLDESGGISVCITDTGCGIAHDDISKVLEPFGQARSDTHHTHEGTGLGLPISKGLTELHEGTFTLISTLEKGTSVSINFPPERTVAN